MAASRYYFEQNGVRYGFEEELNDSQVLSTDFSSYGNFGGSLSTFSDVDWFSTFIPAYSTVTVTFTAGNGQMGRWRLDAFNEQLSLLSGSSFSISNINGPLVETTTFTTGTAGTQYFKVSAIESQTYRSSAYWVKLEVSSPTVSLQQSEVSVYEGDDGLKAVPFTLNLAGTPLGLVVVHYTVRSGTANAGTPYGSDVVGSVSGNIFFGAGETSKTINNVMIWSDTTPEADEYFFIEFDSITGAGFEGAASSLTYRVNVLDDDVTPTISISADHQFLGINEKTRVTFSLSQSSANFDIADVLVEGGSLAQFAGSGSVYTAILTPATNSVGSSVVRVASGAFTNLAGKGNTDGADSDNRLELPFDTRINTAPIASSFSPADGATGVAVGSNVVLIFNEAIQRGTGTIVLKTATGNVVETYNAATSARISISGNTLTLNPTADLAFGTQYFVEFASGSVKDLAGLNYAGTTSFDFTTAALPPDTTPPTTSSFSPNDGAAGVAVASNIILNFTEAIQRGMGNIVLKTASGTVVEMYSAATSAQISISGSTLTLNPTADLAFGTQYFVEFAAGSVKDLAGNNYAGITGYDFTTALNIVTGTPQPDVLAGTGGIDSLSGQDGNDTLNGAAGNDELNGGTGIDVAVYSAARSATSIKTSATGFTVTSPLDGTDTLLSLERLQFSDINVALDLGGNAGTVAKILGAVFGKAEVANEVYAGIGLYYIDGGLSYEALMQLAIDARLGSGASHFAIVDLLYTNVVGSPPSASEAADFVALLDSNQFTAAGLGVFAADFVLNLVNINLVGLAEQGLDYGPYFGG